jgi:cellulose synthase/poly-beta-1,6-N-acetylglucosamine synthase-like glycosyltransferase
MLSIIVTAYKEKDTIGKVISSIVDSNYSGIGKGKIDQDCELIIASPDMETNEAARVELAKYPNIKTNLITDPGKGKPIALNMCLKAATGDWLFLTDGDVYLDKFAIEEVIKFADSWQGEHELGGVSIRPVSAQPKDTMMHYWGNLLADAAHHKRTIDLTDHPQGLSTKLVPKRKLFPLSGYGMLIRNIGLTVPEDVLVDDAYLSYELYNKGYALAYAPEARVLVKYATNLHDYFIQKKRSTGGFVQLWEYGVVKEDTKTRSFWRELEYAWFPLNYATNVRELLWSLMLYPTRFFLWVMIFWERKIIKKPFSATWRRVESTK